MEHRECLTYESVTSCILHTSYRECLSSHSSMRLHHKLHMGIPVATRACTIRSSPSLYVIKLS